MLNLFSQTQVKSPFNGLVCFLKKNYCVVWYIVLFPLLMAKQTNGDLETVNLIEEKVENRYQVAKLHFVEVADVYAITLWILLGTIAKIGMDFF